MINREIWDRPSQVWLVTLLALNSALHLELLPLWLILVTLSAYAWKLAQLYRGWTLPPKSALWAVGLVCGVLVFRDFGTLLGHESATRLIVVLMSLKLLETTRERDAMFAVIANFFLLMTHLLNSQTLASTFLLFLDAAAITGLIYYIQSPDRGATRLTLASLKPVFKLLLLSLPALVVIFLLFPRFQLRLPSFRPPPAKVGYSEDVSPGSIQQLVQSDEVSFRVRFLNGVRPSPESLYWRGSVLYEGAGLDWTPRGEYEYVPRELPPPPDDTNLVGYEITLEPWSGRSLFAIPRIARFEPGSAMNSLRPFVSQGGTLRLALPRYERLDYRAWSAPEEALPPEHLPSGIRARALRVTAADLAVLREVLNEIQQSHSQPAQSATEAQARIDAWYTARGFRYSLDLGPEPARNLREFLLKTRVGFCEHYAGASALLVRAMGFPARLAIGFQGGRLNPLGDTYAVRSREAHAWVEVWHAQSSQDESHGRWRTYDPTAGIAPLRLQFGGEAFDLPDRNFAGDSTLARQLLAALQSQGLSGFYYRTQMFFDYAQMNWSRFLLEYDAEGQRAFLAREISWGRLRVRLGTLLSVGTLLLLISVPLWLSWRRRRLLQTDPWQDAFERLEDALSERGYHRPQACGLRDWQAQLTASAPVPSTPAHQEASTIVVKAYEQFISHQYGNSPNADLGVLHQARLAARQLQPPQTSVNSPQ